VKYVCVALKCDCTDCLGYLLLLLFNCRHSQVMENIETESTALKNALETHTVLLNNKDAEIEKLRNEVKLYYSTRLVLPLLYSVQAASLLDSNHYINQFMQGTNSDTTETTQTVVFSLHREVMQDQEKKILIKKLLLLTKFILIFCLYIRCSNHIIICYYLSLPSNEP